jgi:hypothetical protein
VAVLTLGALALANPVPAASISAPAAAPVSNQASSQAPAAADAATAPATIVDAGPTPTPTPPAVTEPVAEPSAPPESNAAPVTCGTLSQIFQSTHGKRPLKLPEQIVPAIAICADTLPSGGEPVQQVESEPSAGAEAGAGD